MEAEALPPRPADLRHDRPTAAPPLRLPGLRRGPALRIVLFVGRLDTGGAERQVLELARGLSRRGHETSIWTLYPGGALAADLDGLPGVRAASLFPAKPRSLPATGLALATAARRLRRRLAQERADVLYSVLYPPSALAGLAVGRRRRPAWVLGVRSAGMQLNWKRLPFFHLAARLSSRADLLIANSPSGLRHHVDHGFRPGHREVVFNGIDLERFRPSAELRREARRRWDLPEDARIVGRIGRLSPVKDHPTFLRAARRLRERDDRTWFLCVGGGPAGYTAELHALSRELGLDDRLRWTGPRTDMEAVYNALDVNVSSSLSESFPNVMAEAMACGVPGVVTDVGDSALTVGPMGRVVPPADPEALAGAVEDLLARPPSPDACRGWVERFGVEAMVEATERALEAVLARRAEVTL